MTRAAQLAGLGSLEGSAPAYACRAWVNFNGTGTVAIRASGNVSSITDDGTGTYRVNFTDAMPDANYAVVISSSYLNWISSAASTYSSNVRIKCVTTGGGDYDPDIFCVSIFR